MGIKKLPIIVYSHYSYSDVWPLIFSQIKKYHPKNPIYLFTNEGIFEGVKSIYYSNFLDYNNRVIQCLSQIKEKIFLFLHEDMPLYATPNYKMLNRYLELITSNQVDSIKLIFAGEEYRKHSSDETLSVTNCSRFSIQPTLIKKSILLDILEQYPSDNLWQLESNISLSKFHPYEEYCSNLKGKKRGIHHYDSEVYPYIATAIVKGEWNFKEYPELKELLDTYHIKSRNYL